ncbi:MAG TPA: pirin family protein [Polyangiaceae bacterium]|nr:pirin family protein [Polyangiaceae bacterium]
MTAVRVREAEKVLSSHRQLEGAGFIVRRPLPAPGLMALDPFLLIDELGPIEYKPGEAVGAPDHPHRGFETVSYVLEGEVVHEDSAGHSGTIKAGGVQWMTAGGGIIHSETPSAATLEGGGRMHGFQIWVNLPARLKMTRPRYQELGAEQIPSAQSADGLAKVKIIAGEALGVRAAIDTHTPIVYQDWSLEPGADVTVSLDAAQRVLVYVFSGSAKVGDQAQNVGEGQLAVLGQGDAVRLRGSTEKGRLLLLAGAPLGEPVARYGPFVMNTEAELRQAFQDYQSGRMGEITRTAQVG